MFFKGRRALRSRRKKEADKKLLLYKGAAALVAILILFGAIAYGANRPEINIETISYEGIETISRGDFDSFVNKQLSGNFAFVFPKTNIALFPDDTIKALALDGHKRIKDISIKRTSLTSIEVEIEEREPHALWCGELILIPEEQCYFVDEFGLVYAPAPNFSGTAFFVYYGYLGDVHVEGAQYLPTEEFVMLRRFAESLQALPLTPYALGVISKSDAELHFEEGGKIIFAYKDDLIATHEHLKTVLSTEKFLSEEGLVDFEYIDLRFDNKVYYKVQ